MESFTKSKKDAHPDYVTGGDGWVMERTEQTESREAEDAVREVTIGRLDASVYARRALRSP